MMDVENNVYYWVDGKIVIRDRNEDYITNAFCVDINDIYPKSRYGMWDNTGGTTGWRYVRLESFPEEFRLQLFLLGIP
jgi:hypothetical protein